LLSAHITPELVTAAWGHQYQFYDVRVWSVLRVRALADISPVVRTVKYQTCRFNLDLSVSMVQLAPADLRQRTLRSARIRRFGHVINKDGVLGTHTGTPGTQQ
jgi:hypothetical protein